MQFWEMTLSVAQTDFKTIRIETLTSLLDWEKIDSFSLPASFLGKNFGLPKSATKHFTRDFQSEAILVYALFSCNFKRYSSNFRRQLLHGCLKFHTMLCRALKFSTPHTLGRHVSLDTLT